MNRFCLFILISFFSISNAQSILRTEDTLLVFFSDNKKINTQYYDMLHLKFPDAHLINIAGIAEFYRYIPISSLSVRKHSTFLVNQPVNFKPETNSKTIRQKDTSQKDPSPQILNYAYFDISEVSLVASIFTPQFSTYTFNLVRYNGEKLEGTSLAQIYKNENSKGVTNPWKLDESSEWVNPLLVAMYLDREIMEKISDCKSIQNTCKVQADDYIYISGMLNDYYLGSGNASWNKYKDPDTATQLKYFKHKHTKMSTAGFNRQACQILNTGQHFYFYYFDPAKCIYHIIDGYRMTLVISFAVNKKGSIDSTQKEENIKKLSNFISDCKD